MTIKNFNSHTKLLLDIRLMEVYGATESMGPQITGLPFAGWNRFGSIGRVNQGVAEAKVKL